MLHNVPCGTTINFSDFFTVGYHQAVKNSMALIAPCQAGIGLSFRAVVAGSMKAEAIGPMAQVDTHHTKNEGTLLTSALPTGARPNIMIRMASTHLLNLARWSYFFELKGKFQALAIVIHKSGLKQEPISSILALKL